MKTYFASGFGELEVSWRWFGYAGLLIISMGFCNPCVCTNASVSGKGAGSISSAVASRKLEQSTALRSAEQLSKGGNDLKKKKKRNKSSVQNRSCNHSAPSEKLSELIALPVPSWTGASRGAPLRAAPGSAPSFLQHPWWLRVQEGTKRPHKQLALFRIYFLKQTGGQLPTQEQNWRGS